MSCTFCVKDLSWSGVGEFLCLEANGGQCGALRVYPSCGGVESSVFKVSDVLWSVLGRLRSGCFAGFWI